MGRRKTIADDAVLRHAREVFVADGTGASTKEIALRAGISEAALFQRFHTKRQLLIAALAPGKVDADGILQPTKVSMNPRTALGQLGRRMRDYFREQIPCGLLLMTSGVRAEEFMAQSDHAPLVAFTLTVERVLNDAKIRGDLVADNTFAAAGLFVAAIHSLVIFELSGGHGEGHGDHALDSFATALWQGLSPRKS
jgi:AcrR family transcriptional regulator